MLKKLLTTGLAIVALSSTTALFAKDNAPDNQSKKAAIRAAQLRQLATDLHWRGSNIPPAVSSAKHWKR